MGGRHEVAPGTQNNFTHDVYGLCYLSYDDRYGTFEIKPYGDASVLIRNKEKTHRCTTDRHGILIASREDAQGPDYQARVLGIQHALEGDATSNSKSATLFVASDARLTDAVFESFPSLERKDVYESFDFRRSRLMTLFHDFAPESSESIEQASLKRARPALEIVWRQLYNAESLEGYFSRSSIISDDSLKDMQQEARSFLDTDHRDLFLLQGQLSEIKFQAGRARREADLCTRSANEKDDQARVALSRKVDESTSEQQGLIDRTRATAASRTLASRELEQRNKELTAAQSVRAQHQAEVKDLQAHAANPTLGADMAKQYAPLIKSAQAKVDEDNAQIAALKAEMAKPSALSDVEQRTIEAAEKQKTANRKMIADLESNLPGKTDREAAAKHLAEAEKLDIQAAEVDRQAKEARTFTDTHTPEAVADHLDRARWILVQRPKLYAFYAASFLLRLYQELLTMQTPDYAVLCEAVALVKPALKGARQDELDSALAAPFKGKEALADDYLSYALGCAKRGRLARGSFKEILEWSRREAGESRFTSWQPTIPEEACKLQGEHKDAVFPILRDRTGVAAARPTSSERDGGDNWNWYFNDRGHEHKRPWNVDRSLYALGETAKIQTDWVKSEAAASAVLAYFDYYRFGAQQARRPWFKWFADVDAERVRLAKQLLGRAVDWMKQAEDLDKETRSSFFAEVGLDYEQFHASGDIKTTGVLKSYFTLEEALDRNWWDGLAPKIGLDPKGEPAPDARSKLQLTFARAARLQKSTLSDFFHKADANSIVRRMSLAPKCPVGSFKVLAAAMHVVTKLLESPSDTFVPPTLTFEGIYPGDVPDEVLVCFGAEGFGRFAVHFKADTLKEDAAEFRKLDEEAGKRKKEGVEKAVEQSFILFSKLAPTIITKLTAAKALGDILTGKLEDPEVGRGLAKRAEEIQRRLRGLPGLLTEEQIEKVEKAGEELDELFHGVKGSKINAKLATCLSVPTWVGWFATVYSLQEDLRNLLWESEERTEHPVKLVLHAARESVAFVRETGEIYQAVLRGRKEWAEVAHKHQVARAAWLAKAEERANVAAREALNRRAEAARAVETAENRYAFRVANRGPGVPQADEALQAAEKAELKAQGEVTDAMARLEKAKLAAKGGEAAEEVAERQVATWAGKVESIAGNLKVFAEYAGKVAFFVQVGTMAYDTGLAAWNAWQAYEEGNIGVAICEVDKALAGAWALGACAMFGVATGGVALVVGTVLIGVANWAEGALNRKWHDQHDSFFDPFVTTLNEALKSELGATISGDPSAETNFPRSFPSGAPYSVVLQKIETVDGVFERFFADVKRLWAPVLPSFGEMTR